MQSQIRKGLSEAHPAGWARESFNNFRYILQKQLLSSFVKYLKRVNCKIISISVQERFTLSLCHFFLHFGWGQVNIWIKSKYLFCASQQICQLERPEARFFNLFIPQVPINFLFFLKPDPRSECLTWSGIVGDFESFWRRETWKKCVASRWAWEKGNREEQF